MHTPSPLFGIRPGNHTKVHVQEWSQSLHHTLSHLLAQPLRPAEFSDDRLGILLRRLHQLDDWDALEADLWHGTCDVYELPLERVRLDSTTTYGYHTIAPDGLMQLGHSKDHRPQGQRTLWAILVRCNACAFGRSFV